MLTHIWIFFWIFKMRK